MRVLVAGWFSFSDGTATAGDVLARDLVRDWLDRAGIAHDVATAPPFTGGVDVRTADPEAYTHVVFVCGPFERGRLERILLERFWRCRLVGLDVTLQTPLDDWSPFDFLVERDSTRAAHPDFVFATRQSLVPVVGVCLVEDYPAGDTATANAAIRRLVASSPVAVVDVDTRLDANRTGLRSAAEVESVIARLDAIVTTRLHGMVLALKNGVPAVAIDPEPGGTKIRRQAETIGWPAIFAVGHLDDSRLREALEWGLGPDARERARATSARAAAEVERLGALLVDTLRDGAAIDREHTRRLAASPQFPDWAPASEATTTAPPPVARRRSRWFGRGR